MISRDASRELERRLEQQNAEVAEVRVEKNGLHTPTDEDWNRKSTINF